MSSINPDRISNAVPPSALSKAEPPPNKGVKKENTTSVAQPTISNVGKDQADHKFLNDPIAQGGIKEQVLPKGKGIDDAIKFLKNPANKNHDFVVYYSGTLKSLAVMFRSLPGTLFPLNKSDAPIKDQIPVLKMKVVQAHIKKNQADIKYLNGPLAKGGIKEQVLPKGKGFDDAIKFLQSPSNKQHDFVVYYSKTLNDLAVMFRALPGTIVPLDHPVATIKEQIPALRLEVMQIKNQADLNYLNDPIAQGGINEQVLSKGKGLADAKKFLKNRANLKHDFVVYYSGTLKSLAVIFRDLPGELIPLNIPGATVKQQLAALKAEVSEHMEKRYKSLQAMLSAGISTLGDIDEPSELEGTIYKDASKVLAHNFEKFSNRKLDVNTAFFKKMLRSLKVVSSQEEAEKRLGNPQSKDKHLFWVEGDQVFVLFKDQKGPPYLLLESESFENQIQNLPH